MQRQAVRLNRVAYRQELDLLWAHAPGLALVEEGIDGASRAGTQFGPDANLELVLGPQVGDGLWGSIESLVAPLGWKGTIDLFVQCPRTAVLQPVSGTGGRVRRRAVRL